jgi:putative salt-induced outer membrane protein YdiY
MKALCCLTLFVLTFSSLSSAEVLHFKNGDQLTGEWLRIQGDKVVFTSEALGEVQVPIEKLESFATAEKVILVIKGHKSVRGKAEIMPSGDWQVETPAGKQVVEAKNILGVYPEKLFEEYGYGRKPRLWENWQGKGAMGYSLVRGDQKARTLSVDINAIRRLPVLSYLKERSRSNVFLNMIFANTETADGVRISTNSFTSGLRQDFIFSESNFWFLLAQADHNDTQSLDLRQTYGGGLGHDIIDGSRVKLQMLGGLTYVNEHFQDMVVRKNAEALAGERLSWKITSWLGLDNSFNFYPSLTDAGEYRLDTSSALSTQITQRFSFNTTFTDRYLSRPLPGRRKNEIVVTTGLGVTF